MFEWRVPVGTSRFIDPRRFLQVGAEATRNAGVCVGIRKGTAEQMKRGKRLEDPIDAHRVEAQHWSHRIIASCQLPLPLTSHTHPSTTQHIQRSPLFLHELVLKPCLLDGSRRRPPYRDTLERSQPNSTTVLSIFAMLFGAWLMVVLTSFLPA